jgi:putative transposase
VESRDRLTVIQAYRFALDPTPRQIRELLRHAGAARLADNWGLARLKANLDQRAAERSYGIAEADLTPPVNWSLYGVKTKLRLSERVFTCTQCGLSLDRDTNATNNLASLVKHLVVAGSGPETQNGRGADPKTRPVRAGGCETSTPHQAVPARVRRGPSPSNGRITEIH